MQDLFKNMQPHEVVLFILGTIIAVAIVIAFVLWLFGMKEKKITATTITMLFFSIVMIAFSSIKSFEWGNLKFETLDKIMAVNAEPQNEEARKALEELLNKIASSNRYNDDASAKNIVAKAQLSLGEYEAAKETINDISEKQPEDLNTQLKDSINAESDEQNKFHEGVLTINSLLLDFENANRAQKDALAKSIAQKVTELPKVKYADVSSALVISNAFKVIGNHAQAEKMEQKASNPVASTAPADTMHKEAIIAPHIVSPEALANYQKPKADSIKANQWIRSFNPVIKPAAMKRLVIKP